MTDPQDDKRLFTPGPLTTSRSVKQAMLRDLGSREEEFLRLVHDIRRRLLALGDAGPEFEAVPMQGSGTFAVEAVLSTTVPRHGKLLVLANGAYGERMVRMALRHQIPHEVLRWEENRIPQGDTVRRALERDRDITDVAVVHCETTSGILNPVDELGGVVRDMGRRYIIDAMSSFGVLPVDLNRADYLVSSANKCIEGVPGFGFVLARRSSLEACRGQARTLSLDLYDQWQGLQANGQFRFTPPTHALLAFAQALAELEAEGGPKGRLSRYQENQRTVAEGMCGLGFRPYLEEPLQSPIITTFHEPKEPAFQFDRFYRELSQRGFVIYPGKLTKEACFRIGSIGRLDAADMQALVSAAREVLTIMGLTLPLAHEADA